MTAKHYQEQAFNLVNELVISHRDEKKIRLTDGRELIEFISCSYLGLDQDPRLLHAYSSHSEKFGIAFHSARTRVLPENYLILEKLLNRIYCQGYSITFPNVHMIHLGILPLLGSGELPSFPIRDAGVVFILDKKVHASVQINRGLMSQFGDVILTDLTDLVKAESYLSKTQKQGKTPIVISDSIRSMRGLIEYRVVVVMCAFL